MALLHAVLSAFIPGLGQLIKGQFRKALYFFAGVYGLAALNILASVTLPGFIATFMSVILGLAAFIVWVWNVGNAYTG